MLASGKKDIVKMLIQKAGIFVSAASDNRDKLRLKTFPRARVWMSVVVAGE